MEIINDKIQDDEEDLFFDTTEGTPDSCSVIPLSDKTCAISDPIKKINDDHTNNFNNNINFPKKKKRIGALQEILRESDDLECLDEEEGLGALEPDVMSIYKLLAIEEYSSTTFSQPLGAN